MGFGVSALSRRLLKLDRDFRFDPSRRLLAAGFLVAGASAPAP
jgi:hypothetical protein